MKRFIALTFVVLLAASCGESRDSEFALTTTTSDAVESETDSEVEADSDGAEDEPAQPTTTLAELTPDTTGVASEVAMSVAFESSEWEITHGELNDIVGPTIEEDDFSQLVFNGPAAPGFAANVLTQLFVNEALALELVDAEAEVTQENLDTSKEALVVELNGLAPADLGTPVTDFFDDEPYLSFLTEFQARQDLLSTTLADGVEPTEQTLPCARHILVETEDEANEILAELEADGDFGEIAKERSLDPGSGANGGELGCADPANYVPEFKAAIEEAEVGVVVGPVTTQFGAHLIIVDSFETSEVVVDGRQLATEQLQGRLASAEIDLDPAIGTWDAQAFQIIPSS